jgi:hypothetical protein
MFRMGVRDLSLRKWGLFFVLISLASPVFAIDVLTWHNDQARTGQNLNETILTPANVNFIEFGKLFVIPTDGQVYAQPLYVSSLSISGDGGTHNVVYIATEHDTVYACDADDGTVFWQVSLLKAGETPSDTRNCNQISPEIGITATPVIDLNVGPNGIIYVAAMSKDSSGNYFQRLHALDLTTGAEQFGGPVDVAASYPGIGDNSSGGTVFFDPKQYKERAGLVLSDGIIYTTWASHCDIRPYTGWVIGYDQNTLARVRVLNLTPNGTHGAIWASGAAPAVDGSGNLFALTGDGTFETTLNANGFPNQADFGNCFVKLSTANGLLQVADYWTMFDTIAESNNDADLGSGGAVLLPDMTDTNGATRHLVAGAGKDGHIYIADRDNLGKFNPSSNANLYQDVPAAIASGVWGAPAYFNGQLYYGGIFDSLKAFQFTNATLSNAPLSQSAVVFGYPGTTPSISANGTSNGILWTEQTSAPAVLRAYDATDLAIELYNSNQAPNSRDQFGNGNKFAVPTIANGKVYVGATSGVGVFGLFNPPAPTPTPTYTLNVSATNGTVTKNPDQTDYLAGTRVTLSATPASGYQFTGWSGDVFSSSNPLILRMNSDKNIVANFALPPVAMPRISPNGGTFKKKVKVTLTSSTSGATIYYTLDGSDPTTSSTRYAAAFKVKGKGSKVLKAKAVKSGYEDSAIATASFKIR